MSEQTRIQVSLDKDLKDQAESYIKMMGLNRTTVISALYQAIITQRKLPFNPQVSQHQITLQEADQAMKQAVKSGSIKRKKLAPNQVKELMLNDEEW